MIRKIFRTLRTRGITGLLSIANARMRSLCSIPAKSFNACKKMFENQSGIEIGGPSLVFSAGGIFPVYPIVSKLDNCNFSSTTVWEGSIEQGLTFQYSRNKAPGRQYVVEATAMAGITSAPYDFVLSSHVIEHTANPILALSEWAGLLKDHGILALIVPHKDGTFDHKRPVTTIEHLIKDFNTGMTEDDLTHMPEILALHDLARDPEAGDLAVFKDRSLHNFENRCFHHHVFDTRLAVNLIDYLGLQIYAVEAIQPMHILIIAKKMKSGESHNNSAFTCDTAQYRKLSPFSSDHP